MSLLFRVLSLSLLVGLGWGCSNQPADAIPASPAPADVELVDETTTVAGRVPRNATLAGLLREHQLAEPMVTAIVNAAQSVFDLRRLRAQQSYRLVTRPDGGLTEFWYGIDRDQFLRVTGNGTTDNEAITAEVVPYVKQRALVALQGDIDEEHSSLVGSLESSGETVELAIGLADVFAGEIDFNNDLRRGDSFQMLYEAELREGKPGGYGAVLAAEFLNDGQRFTAFRYQIPGEQPGYYDENGRSLKRMFLKSPLPFTPRVTSRFSRRRLHPVLKTYRPHLGVDYRAATGTPVRSVATGRVVSAGWSGGSGRMVRLRHSDGYETYYLHLSAISKGIRAGARVTQGQQIGRVGSTGLATAPHLDYRVRKNGRFLNPTSVHRSLPPGKPIPPEYLATFESLRDLAVSRLFEPAGVRMARLAAPDPAPAPAP